MFWHAAETHLLLGCVKQGLIFSSYALLFIFLPPELIDGERPEGRPAHCFHTVGGDPGTLP